MPGSWRATRWVTIASAPMTASTPFGLSSLPMLSIITWSPFVGALLIMFLARRNARLVRGLAVASTAVSLVFSIVVNALAQLPAVRALVPS